MRSSVSIVHACLLLLGVTLVGLIDLLMLYIRDSVCLVPVFICLFLLIVIILHLLNLVDEAFPLIDKLALLSLDLTDVVFQLLDFTS